MTVDFGGPPVLDRAGLTVGDGEVVALLGASGSGKSTLLRVIAGLVQPASGTVVLDGRDITGLPTHRRGIGMVFQDEQLFPHRDVAANVAFGLRMKGVPPAERDRRVAEMLALVGLDGFGARRVTELSGGEAKRVALARSLAPAPSAILLDEPLTGLDRELHDRLAGELARILRVAATTALIVTHDRDEAGVVADRVVMMDTVNGPDLHVVELRATATHDLRRRVLRAGTPSDDVVFAGDDDPTTVHLGLADRAGTLVAVSTWAHRPFPTGGTGAPGATAATAGSDVQLRGMAVDPADQGRGVGAILLAAGLERAGAAGADAVWANARDTALDFYRRHGFRVIGDGFLDATTGLPHHRIRRAVD
ncbi:MAG: GNAT family N-acetyltransferase [Ilumatobacteraceae bacterium]